MTRLPSLAEFMETYGTQEACWNHLRRARWGHGFQCPRCDETEHWGFIQTRKLFQCHACGYQTSVTAGTIMQDTKLPLTTWFLAARLVLTMKKGISSHELARQLGVKQETAWYLQQRLACVVKRTSGRKLFGLVEADESYVGGNRGHKEAGRHTSKQRVMGLVENKDASAGTLVLEHVEDASRASLFPVIQAHVERGETVRTDAWPAYFTLGDEVPVRHEMIRAGSEARSSEILPWIHVVFGNLKRVLTGVHTKASKGQFQDYLDLFAYRFNHRSDLQEGLERGIQAFASSKPRTREELKAGELARVY